MTLSLTPISPTGLNIVSNDRDILRDLFTYLEYAGERNIKRMTRSNEIPRADLVRLAKLMEIEPPEKDEWIYARPYWISFIDNLALSLGLVSYDLKGEYRGQNSADPTFIENYVVVDEKQLGKFLKLAPAQQEKNILDSLNLGKSPHRYDDTRFNEFFHDGPLGILDKFNSRGSTTGVLPTLNFSEIRLFLLGLLNQCPPGQWFSTQSLVAFLKANHPTFLIPKDLPKIVRWGKVYGRYDNFYEGSLNESPQKTIQPDEPDAFERVEGRYVERFFEYIPLIMRFVDVAYDPAPDTGRVPSCGELKAFRVNERLQRLMSGKALLPKVTVQPNFEIVIESDFYPAALIHQVAALGHYVSSPKSGPGAYVGIFRLHKAAVAAAHVAQPNLDVVALLKTLGGRDLPPNVQIELEEWAGHADQFTLYEGFSILESEGGIPKVDKFTVEQITPNLRLVRSAEALFSTLESLDLVPLRIQHPGREFKRIPESAASVFPKESAVIPKAARPVKASRMVTISYQFPDQECLDAICKTLAELRCPFQADPKIRMVTFQQKEQAKFDEALVRLQDTFAIEIE
jgi:hypothetical protein